MSKTIPLKYSRGKARPVRNVGQLVKQLQELPPDMLITQGFGDRLRVIATLFNHEKQPRLTLEELGEDDDEYEDDDE